MQKVGEIQMEQEGKRKTNARAMQRSDTETEKRILEVRSWTDGERAKIASACRFAIPVERRRSTDNNVLCI